VHSTRTRNVRQLCVNFSVSFGEGATSGPSAKVDLWALRIVVHLRHVVFKVYFLSDTNQSVKSASSALLVN